MCRVCENTPHEGSILFGMHEKPLRIQFAWTRHLSAIRMEIGNLFVYCVPLSESFRFKRRVTLSSVVFESWVICASCRRRLDAWLVFYKYASKFFFWKTMARYWISKPQVQKLAFGGDTFFPFTRGSVSVRSWLFRTRSSQIRFVWNLGLCGVRKSSCVEFRAWIKKNCVDAHPEF